MTRALDTSVRSIRLPAHREVEHRALARAGESLEAELHRRATVGELAEATGLEVSRVRADLQLPLTTVSLSAPIADDARCLGDVIADPSAVSPQGSDDGAGP